MIWTLRTMRVSWVKVVRFGVIGLRKLGFRCSQTKRYSYSLFQRFLRCKAKYKRIAASKKIDNQFQCYT